MDCDSLKVLQTFLILGVFVILYTFIFLISLLTIEKSECFTLIVFCSTMYIMSYLIPYLRFDCVI